MNAKFATVPLLQRWCSLDADSFWSASGAADGPINGDHSARPLHLRDSHAYFLCQCRRDI